MTIKPQLERTLAASRILTLAGQEVISRVLISLAAEAEKETFFILAENRKDLDRMDPSDPRYDRLLLTRGEDRRHRGGYPECGLPALPVGCCLVRNHAA